MRSTEIPSPAVPLSDGFVSLRSRRASDLDAISDASFDPGTRHWLTDPPMDAEARVASMERVAEAFRTGRSAPLVIAYHESNEPIGLIIWRRSPTLSFPHIAARGSRPAQCA
jgi:hypothetical protein